MAHRDDLPTDTNGLLQRISEFLRRCRNSLAVYLVGPATIVTEAGDDLAEVAERVAVWLTVIPSLNCGQDLFLPLGKIR
ncbi:hypothetical protein RRF57_000303 [Xylaria bambusicola]|uniref:Uncharacterized protein n=1 Tax=Xylaria bambusicola TaxID=326684 RepID=A0AAN7UAH0_9PEZI